MADYKLLAILSTGKPGVPNSSNYGLVDNLKIGSVDFAAHASQHQHSGADEVSTATPGANAIVKANASGKLPAGWGGSASGIATLNASSKVVEQPASISDFLEASPSDGEAGKAPDSNWAYDHANGADPHSVYSLADGTRAFTGNVSGIAPTSAAHLTRKDYVDGLIQGLKSFKSVVVRATGNIDISSAPATIDGVTMGAGERCCLDQQTTSTEDGVYVWNSVGNPMTRATDVPTGTAFAAAYLFVKEGSTYADVGFVCTNNDGADVIGTDDIVMTEFSRAASYTGGDGIDVTTTVISVDLGTDSGLEFVSNQLEAKIEANKALAKGAGGLSVVPNTAAGLEVGVSGVGINLEVTTPSLQVTSTELGIKFDADGGLQKVTDGTAIKLSGTTLQLAVGGISVKGVGALFEIATVAVGSGVTAANLTEVTDGSETTLHSHAGSPHDFEGAAHNACTLAEFNTSNTISDKDLIASDDSRLSDDRDPNAHAADHKHGGGDEVAQAAAAANAIPKGDASGNLAAGWGGAASTLATLNGSTKVVEDPASAQTTPAASKIPIADGSGKLAAGWGGSASTLATLNGSSKVVEDPANATATPTADKIVIAEGDGKIAAGWIDTGDITGQSLTWSGDQEFNGETTVDELIGDGDYAGIQIPRTVGTGGITAGDILTFDGTGQIIRRSDADQISAGIAAANAAASALGHYVPIGVGKALFTSGKEPSSAGQNVFTDNTPGNYHKLTTDVQTDGIVYSAIAIETGALAKVIWMSKRILAFE